MIIFPFQLTSNTISHYSSESSHFLPFFVEIKIIPTIPTNARNENNIIVSIIKDFFFLFNL